MSGKPCGSLGAGAALLLALFIHTGQAQTLADLDRLIFEPVPLVDGSSSPPPSSPSPVPAVSGIPGLHDPAVASFAAQPEQFASLAQTATPVTDSAFLYVQNDDLVDDRARLITTDAEDSIALYQEDVRRTVMEKGPYAIELADKLLTLGELYQALDEHAEALETFARAEHVVRVNYGLYSLGQVDSIGQMIESLVAMEDMQAADEKYRYLVYLHEREYGAEDVRTVPALRELARWSMDSFQHGVRFEAQGMLIAPGPYGGGGSEKSVRRAAFSQLYQAQGAYLDAIEILVENEEFRHPGLVDLERSLIETYFLQAHQRGILEDPDNYLNLERVSTGSLIRRGVGGNSQAYHSGKEAYGRILTYQANDPDTAPEDYARTLMELGDWYLLFGRRVLGLRKYEEAREVLDTAGLSRARAEALLRPEVPLTAPVFTPTPHTREIFLKDPAEELDYRGYIDLSFNLNRYGRARDIEVLGTSDGTSGSVQRRLTRLVRQTQFRPRFQGSEIIEEDPVSLRYYYTY